jgi:hypothetical protein
MSRPFHAPDLFSPKQFYQDKRRKTKAINQASKLSGLVNLNEPNISHLMFRNSVSCDNILFMGFT